MQTANEKVWGDYESVYTYRTDNYLNHLVDYLFFGLWDVLIFMFLGMAFFKMGILTGHASMKTYWWMCIVGFGIGLTLSYFRIQPRIAYHFNTYEIIKNTPFSFYELARTPRAIGFLGLVMLLYKSGWITNLFSMLRLVGQMAFSNYLMQSLICSIIFNGFGFGLFGKLQRYEIYIVVAGIWVFQIIFSNIWLRYFLYGPFEWAWRSLTYWKKQPFIVKQK